MENNFDRDFSWAGIYNNQFPEQLPSLCLRKGTFAKEDNSKESSKDKKHQVMLDHKRLVEI